MIKPTRYDLYKKAITPKPKIDKRMITVEEACLFGEWLNERFIKTDNKSRWYPRRCHTDEAGPYTTKELWELYQQSILGKKPDKGTPDTSAGF